MPCLHGITKNIQVQLFCKKLDPVTPKKNPGDPESGEVVARHRTPDQGRQGARDKKRDKLPSDKGLKPAGCRRRGGVTPPKTKIPNSLIRELRIAPVLLGPQVGGRACRAPLRPAYRQVFWLLARPTPGAFPEALTPSGFQPVSSPITAAGPRRSCTVFSFNR